MHTMKRICVLSWFIILGLNILGGMEASGGNVFELQTDKDLKLKWQGKELITGDFITYIDNKSFAASQAKIKSERDTKNWQVINVWGNNSIMGFRKEVAISPNNDEVELNIKITRPSYKIKKSESYFNYDFKVPFKTLRGMKWQAICGRSHHKKKYPSGILDDSTPANFIGSPTRYLVFEGNGKQLVFDFNPEGVGTYSAGSSSVIGQWSVRRKGDYLHFFFGRPSSQLLKLALNSKVIIFEGSLDDYMNRHAWKKFRYFHDLPVNTSYCFGADKHGKIFTQAAAKPYNSTKGFGWLSSAQIKIEKTGHSGALYSSAYGKNEAIFKSKVPQPGIYLITLNSSAYSKESGKFSFACNGKNIIRDIKIKPYMVNSVVWPQWLEEGKVEFKFNGAWRVSSITLQLLQHSKEDFRFRRGFWRISGLYEPTVLYKNIHFAKEPKYQTSVKQIPLPRKVIRDIAKVPSMPPLKVSMPNNASPQMSWRFHSLLGTLGMSNGATFNELTGQGLLERRVSEVKKRGDDAIIINGLLSRHTFPNHLDRVKRELTRIIAEGHKNGMHMIDHQDYTLLWNMGSGFRLVTEHTDWLQRNILGGLTPTTGLCPINPEFSQHFLDYIIDLIKTTCVDGIMIDEVAFHGTKFCGCSHCRAQFTKDTGLTLPMDETSPLITKPSNLRAAWYVWRRYAISKWWERLRSNTNKVNPYLSLLRYTTHYALGSSFGAVTQGATLSGAAHVCDFVGTEIMTRNVMASARSVAASRKLNTCFREGYGSPVFGLVYPEYDPNIAYFGWILNAINAQVTWYTLKVHDKDLGFTKFKGMDFERAWPWAETALLYSFQSRDTTKSFSYPHDVNAVAQILNDLHIQYTVLMDRNLNYDKLKQYKQLILPGAACLSEAQISAILRFVREGGKLLMTTHTAMLDEVGNYRKNWPFADILGVRNPINPPGKKRIRAFRGGVLKFNGEKVKTKRCAIRMYPSPRKKMNPFMTFTYRGKATIPAGIEANYGRGQIMYIAGQFSIDCKTAEIAVKRKVTVEKSLEMFKLYAKVIRRFLGDKLRFEPIDIPEMVLCTVYRQNKDSVTSIMVNLVNATGTMQHKIGNVVSPKAPSEPFPALKSDIVFKIKIPTLKQAFVTSPDFDGEKRPAKFQKISDGYYEITVPKELVKSYSIVWLR